MFTRLYKDCKGKYHSITSHTGPDGEYRYSSNLSLTSALDVLYAQHHALAALPPGMTGYPLCRRLGGSQDRSGRVWKSASTAIRCLDRSARSESIYRLSYLGTRYKKKAPSKHKSGTRKQFAHYLMFFVIEMCL
jgi:hypothetical protein